MKLFTIILFFISFVSFGSVRKDKSHPCYFDFPLYCSGIERPEDDEFYCLTQKMNLLSSKCQRRMEADVYLKNPCGKDILQWCNGSKKNSDNLVKCLVEYENKLSLACKKLLPELVKSTEKTSSP